ncbi:MAG: S-layer homology domain-containing protein [Chloroflexia bacterium]
MIRRMLLFVACLVATLAVGGVALASGQNAYGSSLGKLANNSPSGCPMNFTDVQQGSTYYNYILALFCNGIIGGYPDNTFRPNNDVTRGQLSKIVAQSAGYTNDPGLQLFEDVLPGSTYYTPVQQLVQFGIINGYNCGGPGEPCSPQMYRYFRPNASASRGQIAKIITQAKGWFEQAQQLFQDVPMGSTFYNYVNSLYLHNAASGYPCGGAGEPCVGPGNLPYFRPNNNVTRGQISKIDAIAFFSMMLKIPGQK